MRELLPTLALVATFHAPTTLMDGGPAHDRMTWAMLQLKGQAAAYRPACEPSVACWDSVVVQDRPDTLATGQCAPGDSISVSLAVTGGQFVAIVRNRAGWSVWSKVVVR